jgi:hypothetical protein
MNFLARASRKLSPSRRRPSPRWRPGVEPLEERCLLTSPPFTIGGDPRVHASDFRMTTFATGLDFPTAMVRLADGSMLVTTNPSSTGNFYSSTGELRRLVDANGDGAADGPGTVLYTGLPGSLTALRQAGNLFLVTTSASGSERINVLRAGATPADPLSLVGSINFSFLANWEHTTYELAVRPTPGGSAGDYDVFWNIGSFENDKATTATAAASGLLTGTLHGDAIYMATLHDSGSSVTFSNLTQIATGLRNAAGMAFQPGSGNFFFQDNGIDGGGNPEEELSADELNRIFAPGIGGAIENFGFPSTYIDYFTGQRVGSGGVQPVVAYVPGSGPEIAGAFKITFAPAGFPTGLSDGVLLGFHGLFDEGGTANDENPVAYTDLHTRTYFNFIAGSQAGVGHLDGLMATNDSLFLADISTNGDIFGSQHTGAIYQIKSLHGVLTASGRTVTPHEGQAFTGTVASFSESNLSEGAGSFTASIDWGDGTTSAGTIVAGTTPGKFTVTGSHTYAEESGATPYAVTVTITDGSATATAHSKAAVADASLGGTFVSFSPTAGKPFTGVVARFTDHDPGGTLTDYSATIDWGDGNTSAGTIALISGTTFRVSGSNTYTTAGTYTVSVTIQDVGGASVTVHGTITVAPGTAPLVARGGDSGHEGNVPAGVANRLAAHDEGTGTLLLPQAPARNRLLDEVFATGVITSHRPRNGGDTMDLFGSAW